MERGTGLVFVIVLLALTYIACPTVAEGSASAVRRPLVITTTAVLGSIVRDLAGDLVFVEVIASPAVCPAHYDVRPSDIDAFRKADLILAHGMEPWVSVLRESSGTQAPVAVVRGGWNTPTALRNLYRSVAKALTENLGIEVGTRLSSSLKSIDEVESWLKSFAVENGFVGRPVVAMRWQSDFLSFLGFRVVATYGPPETVTVREYEEVIANATREGALLVVDNLQSGVELGEGVAKRVGAVHAVLTNFPWVQPGITNVTDMMKYNARIIARALDEVLLRGELVRAKGDVELWKALTVASGSLAVALAAVTAVLAIRLRRVRGGR